MGSTHNSPEIRDWAFTADWIVETLTDQPVGFIFELGPGDYVEYEDDLNLYLDDEDPEVPCIQVQVLEDDVVMLRRSRQVLLRLHLSSFATGDLPLDRWLDNGHFEDCTDGYIFTRDRELIAGVAVAWFRDTCGMVTPDEIGCEYSYPDTLLPDDWKDPP